MIRIWFVLILVVGCGVAEAQPRGTLWQQALDATPLQAPLAADLLPERPGLEVVMTTKEPGQVLAFGAHGEALWKTPLGEGLAPATPVALGTQEGGGALLALGTSDGAIVALDAPTGVERWRVPFPAPATAVLWARLDGTTQPTLIVAMGASVLALDITGQSLWTYPTDETVAALAAGDIDDTEVERLFGVAGAQAFALDVMGQPLWTASLPGTAAPALALSDADGDRLAEVYAATTGDAPTLVALDADRGTERWQTPLEDLPSFQPSGIIASDLERDATGEILVSGAGGLTVVHGDGTPLWSLATDPAATPELVLADLDRDGRPDVIAAVPGHAFLMIRADGALQYRGTDPVPTATPVVADLDGDRTLEVILVSADRALHALQTPGFATPVLTPWPMAGANAARAQASLADPALADPGFVVETLSLLANGGFETGLEGWHADPAEALSKVPEAMSGTGALQATGGAAARTAPTPLDPAGHTLTALVFGKGEGVKGAAVEWRNGERVLRSDRLRGLPANDQGWRRFTANNLIRPAAADSVVLVLEANATVETPAQWDEASLVAGIERIPHIAVMVNQAGFEAAAQKRFTAMSSTHAQDARFVLLDEGNTIRHEGSFREATRIVDAFGNDWGAYYYQADFTGFETPGTYRIQVTMDELSVMSPPVPIQPDLYLAQLMEPALRFLQAHRAEAGGWQAPGAAAPGDTGWITYALAEIHDILSWRYKASNADAAPPAALLQEMQYGVASLVQAPPSPANAAALARAARLLPEDPTLPEAARKALEGVDLTAKDPMTFNALANLLALNFDPALQQAAEAQLPAAPALCAESLVLYEPMTLSAEPLSFTLAMELAAAADAVLLQANNPFGVYTPGQPGKPDYFGTTAEKTAGQGNTRMILEAARTVAQAYRFNPKEEYLRFVYDQFNWILGNNPEGVSLMAGVGAQSLPAIPGCTNARDCAGGIAEGFVGRGPGDDRPYLAMTADADRSALTSAVTLDNVTLWLQTIGYLKRVRR